MKTRILFLTIFTSISILLITNGLAFAEPITGCLQKSTGKIYNAQIGSDQPTLPCAMFDEVITWSEEGEKGDQGDQGDQGEAGLNGTTLLPVHLEDFANTDCEDQSGAPTADDTLG